jgi:hypothetical protein
MYECIISSTGSVSRLRAGRKKNMVMGSAGPWTKNNRAVEDQQKFTWNGNQRCWYLAYTASKLQDVSLMMIWEGPTGSGRDLIQVQSWYLSGASKKSHE